MKTPALISLIAHYEHAVGISKSVPGMEGFEAYYLKTLTTGQQVEIFKYRKLKAKAASDVLKMMEGK